jgi:hypothetical protein
MPHGKHKLKDKIKNVKKVIAELNQLKKLSENRAFLIGLAKCSLVHPNLTEVSPHDGKRRMCCVWGL